MDNSLIDAMRHLTHTMRCYRMEYGPFSDDEPDTVTIEFDALDGKEARTRAQHMLDRAQEMGRSTPRGSTVVWVVPAKDIEESSLRFLGRARELFEEEDYALAVVVAQIHLETQVATLARLISKTIRRHWRGLSFGTTVAERPTTASDSRCSRRFSRSGCLRSTVDRSIGRTSHVGTT